MRTRPRWAAPWVLALLWALFSLAHPSVLLAQEGTGEQPPGEAPAEEEDEEAQAAKLFTRGSELYKQGNYKEAIEELLKAYQLRPAPPILLNIARTYEKLDDKKNALQYYKEFLLKARMVDPNRPMVEKVVKELEKEVGTQTGAVSAAGGPDTPDATRTGDEHVAAPIRRQQLIHTPVDSAKSGEPITLVAELPPNVDADYLMVHYRKGGEIRFRHLTMEEQGEAFVARIPARHVTSTSLQYYIEAFQTKGTMLRVVATAGSKSTPHIVVIEGGQVPLPFKPGEEKKYDIKSPYRTWVWVAGATAVALLGTSVLMLALSIDRNDAMEEFIDKKSSTTTTGCPEPLNKCATREYDYPTSDGKPVEWEADGQTFNEMGWVFFGVGLAAVGATAGLLALDILHVQKERERRIREEASGHRFTAAPWAGPGGAGITGRIEF